MFCLFEMVCLFSTGIYFKGLEILCFFKGHENYDTFIETTVLQLQIKLCLLYS